MQNEQINYAVKVRLVVQTYSSEVFRPYSVANLLIYKLVKLTG